MQLLKPQKQRPESLADGIYRRVKEEILNFRLLPGDRFSEGEVAERLEVSRTPVRQALHRLEREGYLDLHFRSGWQVKMLDLEQFDQLYDVRVMIELEALRRLCARSSDEAETALAELASVWCVSAAERLSDGAQVAALDERFHCQLVEATGNREMARIHAEVSERIRILRRLDFTEQPRVDLTYQEHQQILEAIISRRVQDAQQLLQGHIEASKAQVRNITLHMLHRARRGGPGRTGT